MAKANILEFFAWVSLIVGSSVAVWFLYQGVMRPYGGSGTMLIGLGIFFGSLLQFAVIGGLGEIISRLVKIAENTEPPMGPAPVAGTFKPTPKPIGDIDKPVIGRESR